LSRIPAPPFTTPSYNEVPSKFEKRIKSGILYHECPAMMKEESLEPLREAYKFLKVITSI
jgi:hypothetical protein